MVFKLDTLSACLKEYVWRTQKFTEMTLENLLYVSHTSQQYHRCWHTLDQGPSKGCGVDKAFKAHSVQGMSTIARGVPLDDILDTADWSRESSFQRFYYRESNSTTYVSKVLQNENAEPSQQWYVWVDVSSVTLSWCMYPIIYGY